MQTDGPTQSNLPLYNPRSSPEPGPATIPTQPPTWPQLHEGSSRAFGRDRLPFGDMYSLALGLSLFANVALIITLIGVLFFTHTGFFAAGGSTPGGSASGSAVGSPTATATAIATSTPSSSGGWLQVTPNSVQLGCGGGQQTQFVALSNNGPKRVGWQADFSGGGDQAGVTVNPNHGDLRAGGTVTLQIQLNGDSGGQQGIIHFDPGTSDAGTPPSLSYTTQGCGG